MKQLFVSYRRSDSGGWAGRITAHLRQSLGDECAVFHDVSSSRLGEDFRVRIQEEIGNSNLVLAVVGQQWADSAEQRRADSTDDVVRFELETARTLNIPVIPVLVGGATAPDLHDLPKGDAWLASKQAFTLRTDEADDDLETLTDRLAELLELTMNQQGALTPARYVDTGTYIETMNNIDTINADNSTINL